MEWIKVKEIQGIVKAQIIKGLLEASGIPVKLKHETAAVLFGISMNGIGKVEILVPQEYENLAKNLIEKAEGLKNGLDSQDNRYI